ncbi:MAG: hypothetical protein PHX70_05260 [Clostridium sp.]|nr:hypothetical protein [Clostridium sp.]
MSNVETLLIIAGVSLGIGGSLFLLFPYLKKIGVNVEDILKKVETVLTGADSIISVAKEIEPLNKSIDVLDVVTKEALKGVNRAEQLYISYQIPADQRKEKATELIIAALKVAGINITDDIKTVIDGYIDDVIYVSKTTEEIKDQETNTNENQITILQQQVHKLTNDNSKLTEENIILQQKLNNMQNIVK